MSGVFFEKSVLLSIFFLLLFGIFSCNSLDEDNQDETNNNPKTNISIESSKVLSFNTRDGKAVASIDSASDNHLYRADTTEKAVTLAKIREDGILESFFK